MKKNTLLRTATALTVAALFTACGDNASAPTDAGVSASVSAATTLDVATVSGDAAKEDVEMIKVNRGAFGITQAIDFERFSRWESCPFDTTAKRFVCADKVRGPFTYTRSYAYLDQASVAQTARSNVGIVTSGVSGTSENCVSGYLVGNSQEAGMTNCLCSPSPSTPRRTRFPGCK